jgi:hypothetical protein
MLKFEISIISILQYKNRETKRQIGFNLKIRVLEPITRVLEHSQNLQLPGYPVYRYSSLDTLAVTLCMYFFLNATA